jgi:hypothetical protein
MHLAQHKVEQDYHELKALLAQTSLFIKHASPKNEALDEHMQRAAKDMLRMDESIRALIVDVKRQLKTKENLTRDDASRKIQDMWKVRQARKKLQELLRSIYARLHDPITGHA